MNSSVGKLATRIGTTLAAAAIVLTAAELGLTQEKPQQPKEPAPKATESETLPTAPAEQFSACDGFEDRAQREACIKRETQKGNPATKTVPDRSGPPK